MALTEAAVVIGGALLALPYLAVIRRRGPRAVAAGLVVAAGLYVVFAVWRGSSRDAFFELSGVLVFGVVAAAGLRYWAPLLAAGWVAHVAWDLLFHPTYASGYTPWWYPLLCVGFDLFVAGFALTTGRGATFAVAPILRYADARGAIRWLGDAFGFTLLFSVPPSGEFVRHARLRLGECVIMLGSVREDDGMSTPRAAGVSTQALVVRVRDVDAHCERAKRAGAEIVAPPHATDFGSREYHARDPEGHLWVFSA